MWISMMMLPFSVFDQKYIFVQIWSKKLKLSLELKCCTRLIRICRINEKMCGVRFFCFRPEKPFLGKSGQKNQNCRFKLKFGTKTNLNKLNSMMMFFFSVFDHKYLSWANLVRKCKIFCSKWMVVSMVVSILSVLDWKQPLFLANLFQKIAIVSLSWKSVLILIRIWRIQ